MDRKKQQAELIPRIGYAFGPIIQHLENTGPVDPTERRLVLARFGKDASNLVSNLIDPFLRNDPDASFSSELDRAHMIRSELEHLRLPELDLPETKARLEDRQQELIQIVLSIPIVVGSDVFVAHTPFAAHCRIKDLCSTVQKELVWLDRYFDSSLFHRYLRDVPTNVQVALVTWPESNWTNPKDKSRHKEFMDVSRLFANERGTTAYRLITNANFHDRWLRCDDTLLSLGGSIKDIGLGATFTAAKLDNTADNRKEFDDPIKTGVEVFGPTQPIHP